MANVTIDTNADRFTYSNSDNAMAQSANASDKANLSRLKSQNEELQEEVNKLTTENQALYGQIAQFKSAASVDISSEAQSASNSSRELGEKSKEYLAKNNVNIANDSASFSKQSIQAHAGSMVIAQANATTGSVQRHTSQ
jgi:predicted RNase H-like nuclease (RuvC/YqgF family)